MGDYVYRYYSIFLCPPGWIEPIIARIADSPKTVICPSIDAISDLSLDFMAGSSSSVGGFYWTLDFNWQVKRGPEGTANERQ